MSTIIQDLNYLGVTEAVARFTGAGDSGGFDDLEIQLQNDDIISELDDGKQRFDKLREKLTALFTAVHDHGLNPSPDYNDEGGDADITLYQNEGEWALTATVSSNYDAGDTSDYDEVLLKKFGHTLLVHDDIKAFSGEITVEYSGHGDSGGVDEIVVEPSALSGEGLPAIPINKDRIRDLSETFIDELHSGYENNSGDNGYIRFNFDKGSLVSAEGHHTNIYMESEGTDEAVSIPDSEIHMALHRDIPDSESQGFNEGIYNRIAEAAQANFLSNSPS